MHEERKLQPAGWRYGARRRAGRRFRVADPGHGQNRRGGDQGGYYPGPGNSRILYQTGYYTNDRRQRAPYTYPSDWRRYAALNPGTGAPQLAYVRSSRLTAGVAATRAVLSPISPCHVTRRGLSWRNPYLLPMASSRPSPGDRGGGETPSYLIAVPARRFGLWWSLSRQRGYYHPY